MFMLTTSNGSTFVSGHPKKKKENQEKGGRLYVCE